MKEVEFNGLMLCSTVVWLQDLHLQLNQTVHSSSGLLEESDGAFALGSLLWDSCNSMLGEQMGRSHKAS